MKLHIYQLILALAFIISLLNYKHNSLKHLPLFLGIAIFFELILGKYLKYYFHSNIISSNLYVIICVTYYIYLFTIEKKRYFLYIFISLYTISVFVSLYIQGFNNIMTIAYNSGMGLVVLALFNYLYSLVITKAYLPLARQPIFWMSIGILFFYSSLFPLLIFANKFLAIDISFTRKLFKIISFGNIF